MLFNKKIQICRKKETVTVSASVHADSREEEKSDNRNQKDKWRQTREGHSAPEVPGDGEDTFNI